MESIQITCATDDELIKMLSRESYTAYYLSLVRKELNKRVLKKLKQLKRS